MEAFESFVALALEAEDLVIMGPVKFMITRQTKKAKVVEYQTHGYEIDIVAARADKLVLASVKSFLGSGGVRVDEVTGKAANSSGYKMLNDVKLRNELVKQAAMKFGYKEDQVEMRLYGGKFQYGQKGLEDVRDWASKQSVGVGPIAVVSGQELASLVVQFAKSKTYRDHEVLMTVKVLLEAGLIKDAEQPKEKPTKTKPSATSAQSLVEATRTFPIGTRVTSNNDGLEGIVVGHSLYKAKTAYVSIWVERENKNYLRAATTLRHSRR